MQQAVSEGADELAQDSDDDKHHRREQRQQDRMYHQQDKFGGREHTDHQHEAAYSPAGEDERLPGRVRERQRMTRDFEQSTRASAGD